MLMFFTAIFRNDLNIYQTFTIETSGVNDVTVILL